MMEGFRRVKISRQTHWKVWAAIALAGLLIYGLFSLISALQPYVTFAEAKKIQGEVRVAVFVDHKTSRYDETKGALEFIAKDKKGETCSVRFAGVPPAGFEQTPMAIVIGRYQKGVFEAESISLKCPSKYEGLREMKGMGRVGEREKRREKGKDDDKR